MPPPTSCDDFLRLLRESNLVELARLRVFLGPTRPRGEPARLAERLIDDGLLTRFQAEQLLQGRCRGFTLGKYRVLERLGAGGMGSVYLCEHVLMRRRVAVKVLPARRAEDPGTLERFYREARATAALDHLNLVRAHDVDQDGALHFLIMDYVDGSSLQEIVTRHGPLAVVRAAHYVRQTACALRYLHEAGLVHRDVKPGNILLDRTGRVRLLDLGLARFAHDHADLITQQYNERSVLGTADYLAPEQAVDSHAADIRADVYALGGTFYFLLTGRPPFPDGKTSQKLLWHQVRDPAPLRQLRPEVPADLAALVARMMAKEPGRRYQSPAEVVEALAPWTSEPLPPPPDEEMPRLCPAARPARSATNVRRLPTPSVTGLAQTRPVPENVADTAPTPLPPPPLPPPRRRVGRAAAWLAVLAVAGLTSRWLAGQLIGTPPDGFGEAGVVFVCQHGGPGTCSTIAAALRQARPGDRIVVAADTWEEAVRVEGGTLAAGVCIEGRAPAGGRVRWRPPPDHAEGRPLIELSAADGLTLRGFVLDGMGKVTDLAVVVGPCPGLALEDLELRGFRRTGLVLRGCAGTAAAPVALRGLRIVSDREAVAALLLEGDTRHLGVRASRFEGPCRAAVVLNGPARAVTLEGNRIYRAHDGLLYRRTSPPAVAEVVLTGNTFCALDGSGLHFETVPPVPGSRFTVERNLFARTAVLARVDDLSPAPARTAARWIWLPPADGAMGGETRRYFRKTFRLPEGVEEAVLDVAADREFVVWLNGRPIGGGALRKGVPVGTAEFVVHDPRVHAFDVKGAIRPGVNVLAVECVGDAAAGGLLAVVRVRAGAWAEVGSDASWRVARRAGTGWQRPGWDDRSWEPAGVVARHGEGPAGWRRLAWDRLVARHFPDGIRPVFPNPRGNVCDSTSREGFPILGALSYPFALPTDAGEDDRFLCYPPTSLLRQAGAPGVVGRE